MNFLFIAEKPSLMREVEACYKNHKSELISKIGKIDFEALTGHVCTYCTPEDYEIWGDEKWEDIDYPMIPQHWKIKVIDDPHKKKTVDNIRNIVRDYDGIIVGTDSDTEGYGIYNLLEEYLGIEDMYALRFIEHSLTDKEILHSLLNMTDYHKDPVHQRHVQSFKLRSRADWLYGMNATRVCSNQSGELMTIGRVKAPTIKLIYDNSIAIDNFVPEKYITVDIKYMGDDYAFVGQLTEDGKTAQKFDIEEDTPDIPFEGVVKSKEVVKKKTHAPKLYDLTAIQSEAGSKYGFKPDETLNIIQSLYETHKLISYPRTQCRYVSSEKANEFSEMLDVIKSFDDLKKIVEQITEDDIKKVLKDKQVVNDKEVQKESHDALLPTSNKPNFDKLSSDEVKICHMIYTRLLAQFLPELIEERTVLITKHGDYDFIAKGNTVIEKGWKALYKTPRENTLPNVSEGDSLTADDIYETERTTKPPKRLTEATLINAMEHIDSQIEDKELKKSLADSKGIGTPATRANIIKDIIYREYTESKKNGLYITNFGMRYIDTIKDIEIVSPVFAARIDTKIKQIQRGEADYDDVYREIVSGLTKLVQQVEMLEKKVPTVDALCPNCQTNFQLTKYVYMCPGCGLKVNKEICKQPISEDLLLSLCKGEKTKKMNFTKKDGKTFQARLVLTSSGVAFDFTSGIKCPYCGNDVKLNKAGAFCDCGLKMYRDKSGYKLKDAEITKLINGEHLKNITFQGKNKKFTADLFLDNETKTVKFGFEDEKNNKQNRRRRG